MLPNKDPQPVYYDCSRALSGDGQRTLFVFNNGGDVLRYARVPALDGGSTLIEVLDLDLCGHEDGEVETLLRADELSLYRTMTSLQSYWESGNFRLNGFIYEEGPLIRSWIELSTEFDNWVEDNRFWMSLHSLADMLGAYLDLREDDQFLNKSWADSLEIYTDDNAMYGPNHGRPRRQMALVRDLTVEESTVDRVQSLIAKWSPLVNAFRDIHYS